MKFALFLTLIILCPIAQSTRRVKTHFYTHCAGQTVLIKSVEIRDEYLYSYVSRPVPHHSLRDERKWSTYIERCHESEGRQVERFLGLKHTEPGYFAK